MLGSLLRLTLDEYLLLELELLIELQNTTNFYRILLTIIEAFYKDTKKDADF